jgi:hypothetical protein
MTARPRNLTFDLADPEGNELCVERSPAERAATG